MKVSTTYADPVFTLELTLKEAGWLKNAMQNPICSEESPEDAAYREELYHSIPMGALSDNTN